MRVTSVVLLAALALSGCDRFDPNARPQYGETGLPKNCRAYVQTVIDGYRSRQYTADESFAGLERNCGINGHAWKPD
ncbi:hypothetical protein ACSFBF_07045 [Variovorax sp. ZT5P49]|uniref:hypothetical protein n=1 Tax=Variovorax sp. ZT5P49 TaxID=3443733 RepID=UPI003F45DE7F